MVSYLLHVGPRVAARRLRNRRYGHTHVRGNLTEQVTLGASAPYLPHVLGGEFGGEFVPFPGAGRVKPVAPRLPDVVRMAAGGKVGRVDAELVVARMKHQETIGYGSVVDPVGEPVGTNQSHAPRSSLDDAVSARCYGSRPQPAVVRRPALHFLPESLHKRVAHARNITRDGDGVYLKPRDMGLYPTCFIRWDGRVSE